MKVVCKYQNKCPEPFLRPWKEREGEEKHSDWLLLMFSLLEVAAEQIGFSVLSLRLRACMRVCVLVHVRVARRIINLPPEHEKT